MLKPLFLMDTNKNKVNSHNKVSNKNKTNIKNKVILIYIFNINRRNSKSKGKALRLVEYIYSNEKLF